MSAVLVIQHAMRKRHIVISPLRLYHYFSTLSHNKHDFRKKLLNKKCVLIFSTNFVWSINHSKRNSARHHKCTSVSCKSHVILVWFYWSCIFSADFGKIPTYQFPSKSAQWEPSCSMRANGHTYKTKLTVAFRNFANAPKNQFLPYNKRSASQLGRKT